MKHTIIITALALFASCGGEEQEPQQDSGPLQCSPVEFYNCEGKFIYSECGLTGKQAPDITVNVTEPNSVCFGKERVSDTGWDGDPKICQVRIIDHVAWELDGQFLSVYRTYKTICVGTNPCSSDLLYKCKPYNSK